MTDKPNDANATAPEPVAVEPVAWRASHAHGGYTYYERDPTNSLWDIDTHIQPLYAAPQPSASPQREGWRDISTAPKDGTMILLFNEVHGEQAVMGWTEDVDLGGAIPEACWTNVGAKNAGISMVANPGYFQAWQPLPAVPKAALDRVEPTHRHKKRGTEYVMLGIGEMQSEWWCDELRFSHHGEDRMFQSVDMREVAIYRSVDDGSLWVRPREEFEDGRFEALPATSKEG